MKRFLSIICILLLLTSLLSVSAMAADGEDDADGDGAPLLGAGQTDDDSLANANLPFVLEAPKYAFLDRLSDDVTEQHVNAAFTLNQSMKEFQSLSQDKRTQAIAMNGLATLKLTAQIDWAIDDPNGWHYDDYWDTDGEDPDGHVLAGAWAYLDVDPGNENVCSKVIFEDFGDPEDKKNEAWNGFGYAKGWKDMLTEDQLTLDEESGHYYVNWDEHTLYIRVRYAVVTEDNDEENLRNYYFSGWSPVASFGKGVEEYYPYMENSDIPVPELSDLQIIKGDEETGDTISFAASIPAEFEENAMRTEVYGGLAQLVYSVRFHQEDGEWVRFYRDAVSGTVQVPIKELLKENEEYNEGDALEVYAIVWIEQHLGVNGEWCGDLNSTMSNTLKLGIEEDDPEPTPTGDVTVTPTEDVTVTPTPTIVPENLPTIPEETIVVPEEKKEVCKVCHQEFDPQFFGVCIFIWLGGALGVIIIISIIVKIVRKKQDEQTDILFR